MMTDNLSDLDKLSERELKLQKIALLEKKIELERNLPHLYGQKMYPWARKFWDSRSRITLLCAANQIGKAECVENKIPTPGGFKKMKDIRVGDRVFSKEGLPVPVVGIPYEGILPSYRVIFNDKTETVVSGKHLWVCKGGEERFRKEWVPGSRSKNKTPIPNKNYGVWRIASTEEIIQQGGYTPTTKGIKRFSIPVCSPVQYEEKSLFDPYYVGLFLGNGSGRVISFNEQDWDLIKHAARHGNLRAKLGTVGVNTPAYLKLKKLGVTELSNKKKIPEEYMLGSIEQRKAILAGLLDTDGYCSPNGMNIEFCSTSKKMAEQVQELAMSLGGIAQIKKRGHPYYKKDGVKIFCKEAYIVNLWTLFNPFKSQRKAARWRLSDRYKHERVITEIKKLSPRKVKCISVGSEGGVYLTGNSFTVTHNSTIQIRKVIHWATAPHLWTELWKTRPVQFWYLYPSKDVTTIEFETKWMPLLPQGTYKDHPVYGWRSEYREGQIYALFFNSGIRLYFKTYAQSRKTLQTGTCHAIFTDEEMPSELFDELMFRLAATAGYFHMVFTATLGQQLWWDAIEEKGEKEKFPDACKQQVSMYDCVLYEDMTETPWTVDKIEEIIKNCKSEAEIQRRVMGRFVSDEGLIYPTYNPKVHLVESHPVPPSWRIYPGIDMGGGGEGHPAAIVFVAVDPLYQKGAIVSCWRGDGVVTTASDVINRFLLMRGMRDVMPPRYDFAAKDLLTISSRMGMSFLPAEKNHEVGEMILNTLFKQNMIKIHDGTDGQKLSNELLGLRQSQNKRKARDDLVDALRYAVASIPWDWSVVDEHVPFAKPEEVESEVDIRRKAFLSDGNDIESVEDEMQAWNELYGNEDEF